MGQKKLSYYNNPKPVGIFSADSLIEIWPKIYDFEG